MPQGPTTVPGLFAWPSDAVSKVQSGLGGAQRVRADARGLADCEELLPMLRRSDEKCGLKQTVAALAAFTSLSSKA